MSQAFHLPSLRWHRQQRGWGCRAERAGLVPGLPSLCQGMLDPQCCCSWGRHQLPPEPGQGREWGHLWSLFSAFSVGQCCLPWQQILGVSGTVSLLLVPDSRDRTAQDPARSQGLDLSKPSQHGAGSSGTMGCWARSSLGCSSQGPIGQRRLAALCRAGSPAQPSPRVVTVSREQLPPVNTPASPGNSFGLLAEAFRDSDAFWLERTFSLFALPRSSKARARSCQALAQLQPCVWLTRRRAAGQFRPPRPGSPAARCATLCLLAGQAQNHHGAEGWAGRGAQRLWLPR